MGTTLRLSGQNFIEIQQFNQFLWSFIFVGSDLTRHGSKGLSIQLSFLTNYTFFWATRCWWTMFCCEKCREISAMSESLKEKPLQWTFSDLNWPQFEIDVTETSPMLDVFSWKLKMEKQIKKTRQKFKTLALNEGLFLLWYCVFLH